MTTNPCQTSRVSISRGLMVAGVLLGVSFALKRLSPDHISPELSHRLLGVLMGAVVVVYANAVPKTLSPLIQMRCNPVAEQAMRRFTGWSLVVGGAAYAVASLIAPLDKADLLAVTLLGAATLLAVARVVWGIARGSRT